MLWQIQQNYTAGGGVTETVKLELIYKLQVLGNCAVRLRGERNWLRIVHNGRLLVLAVLKTSGSATRELVN
jgi:hypothetical protein